MSCNQTARPRAGLVLVLAAVGLASCGERTRPPLAAAEKSDSEATYLAPPAVRSVSGGAAGLALAGNAAPDSTVRLATPTGEAWTTKADAQGGWRAVLPAAAQPRLLGLSMLVAGRPVQAQGYVLVTPAGEAAQLRAGGGALRLGPPGPPRVSAFDFDQEGGAAVSGRAPAGAAVSVRLDGRPIAEGRADEAGRFSVALGQPIAPGAHELEISGDSFESSTTIETSVAAPLAGAPFRTAATSTGLRLDWLTPGGGVQSTLLVN